MAGDMTDENTTPTEVVDLRSAGAGATAGAPGAPAADWTPPAQTAPVAAVRSNRGRWLAGLGVAGVAVAAAIVAVVVLAGRPTPEALRYIPADSAVVGEARFDLPGDQMEALGNLLAHFPGFKDQSTLPDKIDESLSRLVDRLNAGSGSAAPGASGVPSATAEGLDYRTDLKPWLSGPVFVGIRGTRLESTADMEHRGLVSATTNGAVTCDSVLKDKSPTTETYRNVQLFVAADGSVACAIDGRQALLGDPASVKAGLDAHATGGGIDTDPTYRDARSKLSGDQLATLYVNGKAAAALLPTPSNEPSGSMAIPGLPGLANLSSQIPAWAISGLSAESDALIVDSVAAPPAAGVGSTGSAGASVLPLPATHNSVLAGLVPADAILFAEHQGTGVLLQNGLATLQGTQGNPALDPSLAPLLGLVQGLGDAGQLVGWIQDTGIVVTADGSKPGGAVLLLAPDAATATGRAATISSLLTMVGAGGKGIEVHQSTIAGTQVTTITITDPGALLGGLSGAGLPGLPGSGDLPSVTPSSAGPIELSLAAHDRVILLTTGEAEMTKLLGVTGATSLAESAAYKNAASRGLATPRTQLYANVQAGLGFVETLLPKEEVAKLDALDPYYEPLQTAFFSTSSDATGEHTRLVVTVTQPAASNQ